MSEGKPKFSGPPPEAQQILDAMGAGVFAVDRDKRITFMNRAAEEATGVEPGQALGLPCAEVFHSSLCDGDCPLGRALETGRSRYNLDAVFIRQDGRSVLPVKISVSPLLDEQGRITGGVETFHSLTLAQVREGRTKQDLTWEDFIGESPQVETIFETLKVVAPSDATLLLEGPTGTGKDLLAHIIHNQSPRKYKPLVKVNCAALPENLLESELFGYQRGAFTGANRDKPGRFQLADGGTIFLDEVSELTLSLQAKLLRVLEDREFYPLGARRTVRVDVRILAACNKSLERQVAAGLFREDLFYRLNVIHIYLPPLRERPRDIPLLVRRFIQKKNVELGTYICSFSRRALDILLNYDYPGNVRELENILEHACLLCRGDVIRTEHLPESLRRRGPRTASRRSPGLEGEKERMLEVLSRCNWNRQQAARLLNVHRTTLWRRMRRLGIQQP